MGLRKLLFIVFLAAGAAATAHGALPPDAAQAIRIGDFATAHRLLIPLGESNDKDALYQLGRMYQRGLGVDAAPHTALEFYIRAAELGHIEAAYLAGASYEKGDGAEVDLTQAVKWYASAARAGHGRAERKRDSLAARAVGNANRRPEQVFQDASKRFAEALVDCDVKALGQSLDALDGSARSILFEQNPLAPHKAVDCPATRMLATLIKAGWAHDEADDAGNTPLHLAVGRGDELKVRYLLGRGASETSSNEAGWTPRMLALRSGEEQLQELLHVQKRESSVSMARLRDAQQTATHNGWSALSIAAWEGDLALVKLAVAEGARIDQVDRSGHSALYRAISGDHVEVAGYLLKSGATANAELLHLAIERGLAPTVDLLIDRGSDVNALDAKNRTPLYTAVYRNDEAIVTTLLQNGASPDVAHNEQTPLIVAARDGHTDLVRSLLANFAAIDLADSTGCTALCWAIKGGYEETAQFLISTNARNLADHNKKTPAMLAAQAGYLGCLQMLLQAGFDVNERSTSGSHALLLAAAEGHTEVVTFLVEQGGDADLSDNSGDTALIAAVRNDHKDVARAMLSLGASAHARNQKFESAQTLAAAKSDLEWQKMFEETSGVWGFLSGG